MNLLYYINLRNNTECTDCPSPNDTDISLQLSTYALIRYIYIVHREKANQWEFAKVGRLFRILGIAIPLCMETIGMFTQSVSWLTSQANFAECMASYQGLNNTEHIMIESWDKWTMNFVPEWIVFAVAHVVLFINLIVLLNVCEGFLYFAIYKSITR